MAHVLNATSGCVEEPSRSQDVGIGIPQIGCVTVIIHINLDTFKSRVSPRYKDLSKSASDQQDTKGFVTAPALGYLPDCQMGWVQAEFDVQEQARSSKAKIMVSSLRDAGLPQSGERGSFLDNLPTGRNERRLPIIMVLRLSRADSEHAEEYERTYTDNVSAHGLRVITRRIWQTGEEVEVTPVNEQSPVRGKVVYCQKFEDARFVVGMKFEGKRLPWHILERFDGI